MTYVCSMQSSSTNKDDISKYRVKQDREKLFSTYSLPLRVLFHVGVTLFSDHVRNDNLPPVDMSGRVSVCFWILFAFHKSVWT